MNKFYAVIVILMIFILPAGSYLYLQKGYDFRKAALDELSSKKALSDFFRSGANAHSELDTLIMGKVSVLALGLDDSSDLAPLSANLQEQFGMNDQFQILSESESDLLSFIKIDKAIALVDVDGNVRHQYDFNDQELKDLVTHISILLPMPKDKDVTLKRDIDK